MNPKDLYVILAGNEMSIQFTLTIDVKSDKITGFED